MHRNRSVRDEVVAQTSVWLKGPPVDEAADRGCAYAEVVGCFGNFKCRLFRWIFQIIFVIFIFSFHNV